MRRQTPNEVGGSLRVPQRGLIQPRHHTGPRWQPQNFVPCIVGIRGMRFELSRVKRSSARMRRLGPHYAAQLPDYRMDSRSERVSLDTSLEGCHHQLSRNIWRGTRMRSYLLAESVFTFELSVDFVLDERLDAVREYLDEPVTSVSQSVRGDSSHGERDLKPPRRGDNDFTFAWASDRRVSSLSYKSAGVGSKVVGAAVKVLALIAGTVIRGPVRSATQRDETKEPPGPAQVRAAWEASNKEAAAHQKRYEDIAGKATEGLANLRLEMVSKDIDAFAAALKLARTRQLEQVLDVALKEVAKIEAMASAWSEARITRFPRRLSYTLALDELPTHEDATSESPWNDPKAEHAEQPVWDFLWKKCGIWVEVGPTLASSDWHPNPDGHVPGEILQRDDPHLYWRIPRPARLWIWKKSVSGQPVLEKAVDIVVTDRFSLSDSLLLDGRFFGEASVEVLFDDLGFPSKLVQGDKSAVGAIADTLSGIPDQLIAGLGAATTIGTSIEDLRDAADKRSLEVIKRQVEQRAKELELQGVNATADSYAELKRLQQQVEIATAQGSLAPASELSQLQHELAEATARRDLDAVTRDRADAAEFAGVRAEIARLQAQIQLLEAKERLRESGGQDPNPRLES